jgi:hypothetical protein
MTVAKLFEVSADDVTYYTLPGSSGEWNDDAEQIDDTIFGQSYSSTQPGLITWTANGQAYYKGFAGYVASIKQTGTATAMTDEAMALVSGKTYKVSNAAKEVFDYTKTFTVEDNSVAVSANDIETIDWLFGTVTFTSGYTVTGPVTVTGHYLPSTEVARANSFTLTQTAETIDETDYATANSNGGYRVFDPGLRTISLELGGFYDEDDAVWEVLENRGEIVIEINPDGSGLSLARGVFKLVSRNQSGDVGALEEQSRTFNLSVPEGVDVPFNWYHDADTTLSQAIRVLLASFLNQTKPYVRYSPEGPTGIRHKGTAVLTDVTLSSSLDAMNEFAASFQGSGAPTRA